MIIGSGLIATAMSPVFAEQDLCIFAAGVSNSSCRDDAEFARERARLVQAMDEHSRAGRFVYFGTCSVGDPEAVQSQYVQHKFAMETLVAEHPRHVIFRLPQVVGHTPNPHTLLNYLYARISRSESFAVWMNSTRNVLCVEDIARLVRWLVLHEDSVNETISIAHPQSVRILEIVTAFEKITRKRAIFSELPLGSAYTIDCARIAGAISSSGVDFGNDYLGRVLTKYYA
jgi:nucleoside-diphosphate-sugar epimerase